MHCGPLTLNCVQGGLVVSREVLQPLAHDQRQLDLIVKAHTPWADDGSLAGQQDGGGGLQKEEGLLWARTVQLGDVISACIYCVNYGMIPSLGQLIRSGCLTHSSCQCRRPYGPVSELMQKT